jgi:hypothetical protein
MGFVVSLQMQLCFVHWIIDCSWTQFGQDELDAEGVASMLGLQSYWDAAYADELANFHEHGHAGDVW